MTSAVPDREGESSICVLINHGNNGYLSCATPPFDKVDLTATDDGSGRQLWVLEDQPGGGCTIKTYAGRNEDSGTYLSVNTKGGDIGLHITNDGSGRQMWWLDDVEGNGKEIVVRVSWGRERGQGSVLSREAGGKDVTLVDRVRGPDQVWSVLRVPEEDLPRESYPMPRTHPVPVPVPPHLSPPTRCDKVTIQNIVECVHNLQAKLRGKYGEWLGPDGKTYLVHRRNDARVLGALVDLNKFGQQLTAGARHAHGASNAFVRRLSQLFDTQVSHVGDLPISEWAAGITWNGSDHVAWIGMRLDAHDSWCWSVYYFCHELAHCLGSWSHGRHFYEAFRWCLRTAAAADLWNYHDLNMAWQWEPADTTYGSFNPYRNQDFEAILDAIYNPPLDLAKRYPVVFGPSPLDTFLDDGDASPSPTPSATADEDEAT